MYNVIIYRCWIQITISANSASDWLPQENLARLQRAFARKWEFIFMQAEAQVKWVHVCTPDSESVTSLCHRAFELSPVGIQSLMKWGFMSSTSSMTGVLFSKGVQSQVSGASLLFSLQKVEDTCIEYTQEFPDGNEHNPPSLLSFIKISIWWLARASTLHIFHLLQAKNAQLICTHLEIHALFNPCSL